MSTGDLELLAKYSRQGAEDAFAEVAVQAVFLGAARNWTKN